jgi:hypothetical protein
MYNNSLKGLIKEGLLHHKKFMMGCGIPIFLAVIALGVIFLKPKHLADSPISPDALLQNPIREELGDISAKLANIEEALSQNQSAGDLSAVRQSLSSLETEIKHVADHSNEVLSQEIQASTSVLQGELSEIKQEMQTLQDEKAHHKQVDPSNLPFAVQSIDNIQEMEVVTVQFDHTFSPLDVGDTLAGWSLVSANTTKQQAEFKNDHENYVLIDLSVVPSGRASP